MLKHGNLFAGIPGKLPNEQFELLAGREDDVRIERICSRGHATPEGQWYDQAWDEWVALLSGEAELELEGVGRRTLRPGDWMLIPAHLRHRVIRTSQEPPGLWLAVHIVHAARARKDAPIIGRHE